MKEGCFCGESGEPKDWEPILAGDGRWALRCTECGHLDNLSWVSEGTRPLILGLAHRRGRVRLMRPTQGEKAQQAPEQKEVVVYSKRRCPYSWRAKRLLRRKGYAFEAADVTDDEELRAWLARATGRKTVPQIFVDGRPVGGFDDIKALDRSGELDRLVRSTG